MNNLTQMSVNPADTRCPFCESTAVHFSFKMQDEYPVWDCEHCRSRFLNPQPSDEVLAQIYQANYFLGGDSPEAQAERLRMKQKTARLFLEQLKDYRGKHEGTLLEIGCGQGELLVEAEQLGYDVMGVEYSEHAVGVAQSRLTRGRVLKGEVTDVALEPHSFDVILNTDVIEHVRDVKAFLASIHRLLKPGGVLVMTTISVNTLSHRLLGRSWVEFKVEHLSYFSDNALYLLLFNAGFQQVTLQPAYKILTPEYLKHHFVKYPVPVLTQIAQVGYRLLPPAIQQRDFRLTGSGVTLIATAAPIPPKRTLSIVLPVYNEVKTFETLLTQLLEIDLPVEKQIIIVESNSTDGSRERVLAYQNHPNIQVILQDQPRGKGAAVREGLAHATGDFVVIQDADLEYSVEDYPRILQPLLDGEVTFLLGSRHIRDNHWDIRQFSQNRSMAWVMNFGHVLFRMLLNLLYGQRMKDPFTMYKVFWRDCIHDLHLEANRFDFDFELVIKLLRKGFVPVEIPVQYQSRSFSEGKKVRIFADPLTWLRALVKYRFSRLKR